MIALGGRLEPPALGSDALAGDPLLAEARAAAGGRDRLANGVNVVALCA